MEVVLKLLKLLNTVLSQAVKTSATATALEGPAQPLTPDQWPPCGVRGIILP